MKTYHYLSDGEVVSSELEHYFHESDLIVKRIKGSIVEKRLNLVGIIIDRDCEIYIFPKNFLKSSEQDESLIIDVILKYFKRNEHLNLYKNDDFETNYALNSFYKIYDYYNSHGLYYDETVHFDNGFKGNISWKRSLNAANMIYTENGVILSTFKVKNVKYVQSLIGRAMRTAINYTSKYFSTFLSIPPVDSGQIEEQFFDRTEYLIEELHNIKRYLYKDLHVELVHNLIDFYKYTRGGGAIQFKHYNFDIIWEDMVEYYLNNYFQYVENDKPIFSLKPNTKNKFISQKYFTVNKSLKHKNIILDHYLMEENTQYIFDSKYYDEIKSLDYKQISYGYILKNNLLNVKCKNLKTHNILFLPGDNEFTLHFELYDKFKDKKEVSVSIFEYYINVEYLMELYLKQ